MPTIFEIVDTFDLKQAEANKLKIYLIKNQEQENRLLSALASCKTKESKQSLLKDFLSTMSGMLSNNFIKCRYTVCDATTKPFFCSLSRAYGLDKHQGKPLLGQHERDS